MVGGGSSSRSSLSFWWQVVDMPGILRTGRSRGEITEGSRQPCMQYTIRLTCSSFLAESTNHFKGQAQSQLGKPASEIRRESNQPLTPPRD